MQRSYPSCGYTLNKFDEDGYFLKAKARLVVRGDLQVHWGDAYAATLAVKTSRVLIKVLIERRRRNHIRASVSAFLALPRAHYT